MKSICSLIASATLASVWLGPAVAHAYEHQWHAGVGLGYAALSAAPTAHGYGGGLHLTYGLTDAFNALVEIDVTHHPRSSAEGGGWVMANASAGVAYVLDILEWVPYVGLTGGAYEAFSTHAQCDAPGAPRCANTELGISIAGGLDYQLSRDLAVGAALRYHILFVGQGPSAYMNAFARLEYLWGF